MSPASQLTQVKAVKPPPPPIYELEREKKRIKAQTLESGVERRHC